MLQPSQIETVSLRYGAEIAEVSSFLRGTGIAVETPAALDDVVRRLQSNRAFHRDLGSHTWMLLYGGATVPEALAVLAVATLGTRFAATADEDSTHHLLRFVMESRSQLGGKPGDRNSAQDAVPQVRPSAENEARSEAPPSRDARRAAAFEGRSPLPVDAAPLVAAPLAPLAPTAPVPAPAAPTSVAQAPPVPASVAPIREERISAAERPGPVFAPGMPRSITPPGAVEEPVPDDVALPMRSEAAVASSARSNRGLLLLVAACLLLMVAAAGWWFLRDPLTNGTTASQSAPVVDQPADSIEPAPSVGVTPQLESGASPAVRESARRSSVLREPRWSLSSPSSRDTQPVPRSTAAANAETAAPSEPRSELRAENAAPAPVVRVTPPANTRGTAPVIPSSAAPVKAANGPVPNSVLAGRLGSPVANQADAVDDRVAGTKGYPRLLRRKPLMADGTLVAKATPMNVPGSRPAAIPSGTVRSTSLGISAGNLVYAPDPSYPAAAAVQHISGQVKLEAMVDREGNVASARVISGPPMLRDAAVNAVQQWRYRPYNAGGKPQTFTATAVMDFQLQ